MNNSKPFHHKWTISGLCSMCDKISGHPDIQSSTVDLLTFRFYPNGYDDSCSEYVSLDVFSTDYLKYHYIYIECKLSIEYNKKENMFIKEIIIRKNVEYLKECFPRDYLLDPANGLTQNDEFTLCFEGWIHKRKVIFPANFENKAELTRDYFDFSPLLSTKSLTLKWTIENVSNLFESDKSSIELPLVKDETENGETIFHHRIEIIKDLKKLSFKLKSDYNGLIVIETFLFDIHQQKCHVQKKALESFVNWVIRNFYFDGKYNSSQSILADNRLTLFCEIKMINESIKEENKSNCLKILKFFEAPPALQITECTIDGQTGKILQNKVVPLLSSIEEKELDKLEELSSNIVEQISTIDHATIIVNNIYHEHYFENCNIKDSLVNTKTNSIFGNISFKSEQTDCTDLIEKLENVVSSAIEPVLNQNERIYIELKSSTENLFAEVLNNQQEMKKELNALQSELSQIKQTKKVKKSKMMKIVDKIIALLNRIKFQLNKVGTNVTIKVEQVRQSKRSPPKSPESTLVKSNSITEYIEPQISSLIEYVQSVTISQSISTETKQSHIHKLETVKAFLIAHLSTENCLTINPNAHLEIDSITLENAEHKLADIIDNHRSDWDKKLLTKLRDLIVESKSESGNKEETD